MLWHEGIAPLAGAWIETSVTFAYIPALMVVPARARAAILRVAIFASGSIGRFQSAFDSFLPARAIQRFQHCFPYPAAPDHLPSVSQCRFPWPCGSESRDGPSPRRPNRPARPWSANGRTDGAARLTDNLVRGGEDVAMSYPRCAFRRILDIEAGRSQITFPADCERPNPADREHRFRARYSWCDGEPVPLTVFNRRKCRSFCQQQETGVSRVRL
jgi:hypothetical protein